MHITPELLYLETKWASLIPFEKTANLLKEVLLVSETLNASTIQKKISFLMNNLCMTLGVFCIAEAFQYRKER